jgi:glycosyltransferase involved in cell wall biosynthesis
VSRWSASEISGALGLPLERITVVSQGPGPLDAPASAVAVARIRERYGLSRPFFVCVTGGDPRKGLDFLREVWRGPAGPLDADLVAVGGRSAAIHRGGVGVRDAGIRHLGHVSDEDLRALYTGSVALLFPSLAEGFGRPPLEALACATRVVAAPYGAVREVLGDAGEVVPLRTDARAEAVRALLAEGADVRAARLAEGQRRAGAFSWERAAAEVARVCRTAAGSPP